MSSFFSAPTEGSASVNVAILKSWDFTGWRQTFGEDQLPYRLDHLERRGIKLHWTDQLHDERWEASPGARLVRRVESAGVPFMQTLLLSGDIRASDATIAMFESEANFLAAARSLIPKSRRSPFLVITCWLAHVLVTSSLSRRRGYRAAYRSVDRVYCFSRNQIDILQDELALPPDRVTYLPFGVDVDSFMPVEGADSDYILAVGRDKGRDWVTFFQAVSDIDAPVKVLCRPSQLVGLKVPSNVELLGYVDRQSYRSLLAAAAVVVVLTRPVEYPSGQSVLLEAMAMARTVVVSRTPSLQDYLRDGVDCLTVPPRDPAAARERIWEALTDEKLRSEIGASARQRVERTYNSRHMWNSVADDILQLTGRHL